MRAMEGNLPPAPRQLPPPPPWRRLRRQLRAHPLVDPLGQAAISLGLSLAIGALGAWVLGHQRTLGTVLLVIAGVLALAYLGVVGRAVKRDKAIRYWHDRRELRLSVTREQAHSAFLETVLAEIGGLEADASGNVSPVQRQAAYASVLDMLYQALSVNHDDIAIVLAYGARKRYRIVYSVLSPGSRWVALRPDKSCVVPGTLHERLAELADHYYSAEADIGTGTLSVIALADVALDERDLSLFEKAPGCIELIASQPARTPLARGPRIFSVG